MNVVHDNAPLLSVVVPSNDNRYGIHIDDVATKNAVYCSDDDSPVYGYNNNNDVQQQQDENNVDKYEYGYEDAVPDRKVLDNDAHPNDPPCHRTSIPRRSSLKGSSGQQRRDSLSSLDRGEIEVMAIPTGEGGAAKKIRRRISIGYTGEVKVKEVEPVPNLAGKDSKDELWFKGEDYKLFKKKNKKIAQLVKRGDNGGVEYCTRGLERLIDKRTYEARKYSAWYTVLDEQDAQRERGTYNAERVARLYREETGTESQRDAARRASNDAQVAMHFTQDVRHQIMSRRMSC